MTFCTGMSCGRSRLPKISGREDGRVSRKDSLSLYRAQRGFIDEIIEPRLTRKVDHRLGMLENKRDAIHAQTRQYPALINRLSRRNHRLFR